MKNIKYIFQIALCIILFSSCDSFLEPEPRNKYTEMDAWKSVENTYLYVYGFYKPIYEYGPYGKRYGGVSLNDGFSDILRYSTFVMGANGGDVNKTVYNGNISPSSNILSAYSYEYERIRRINEFLYGLDTYVKYNETDYRQIKAQALFSRAYNYFMLVRNHGSVVLRDDIDGPNEAFKARSSEEECWDFIERDLDYAAANLPEEWPSNRLGLLTKGSVLKSRAMLYAKRWDKAVEAAEAVINSGKYALLPDYADAFTIPDNKEAVLSFRFHGQVKHAVKFDQLYCPPGDHPAGSSASKALAVPTQEMVDMYRMKDGSQFDWNNPEHAKAPYENREPRFYKSILYNGAQWKGRTIEAYVGGADGFVEYGSESNAISTTTGYYLRKLLDEGKSNLSEEGTTHWSEVRFAEVLLNHAEALNELGKVKEALVSLNKVRARAGLPAQEETSKEDLRNIIRQERTVELAFEGHRYWDLRRWRIAHKVLDGQRMHGMKITKEEDGSFTYERVDCDKKDRVFEERYYQFPMPSSEIKNNPLCTQFDKW